MNDTVAKAAPGQMRCCWLAEGEQCESLATKHIQGPGGVSDYTHACGEHVEELTAEGNVVFEMLPNGDPA